MQELDSAPKLILGDFNGCSLKMSLPVYKQCVTCAARNSKIIDLCYHSVKNADKSVSKPLLGVIAEDGGATLWSMSNRGRMTKLFCAKNLSKKDFFRLPDPFAKISVNGSGQCNSTDTCKNTLDPKWKQHCDLYIGHKDSITIGVWDHKKVHKKQGAGFLGCVRIMNSAIHRLKDTGCKNIYCYCHKTSFYCICCVDS
ncbi:E3 ubiquitin-protein ligase SMURF1 [Lamellibrachia satsuma]|nr:E3 ubiquitin-protein ligase SMURF1 [Lamellibrachia satsuma]